MIVEITARQPVEVLHGKFMSGIIIYIVLGLGSKWSVKYLVFYEVKGCVVSNIIIYD